MDLGYHGELFLLPFDHRCSFKEQTFGIRGREATPGEQELLEDSKRMIWEGFGERLETPEDCSLVPSSARRAGRDGVKVVVLGRGADGDRAERGVCPGAGVPGYGEFAIGGTIWWDAIEACKGGTLPREHAAAAIAAAYRRFADVYQDAGRKCSAEC